MKWKKMRVIWSFSVVDRRAKDIFSLFLVLTEPKKVPKKEPSLSWDFFKLFSFNRCPFFLGAGSGFGLMKTYCSNFQPNYVTTVEKNWLCQTHQTEEQSFSLKHRRTYDVFLLCSLGFSSLLGWVCDITWFFLPISTVSFIHILLLTILLLMYKKWNGFLLFYRNQ